MDDIDLAQQIENYIPNRRRVTGTCRWQVRLDGLKSSIDGDFIADVLDALRRLSNRAEYRSVIKPQSVAVRPLNESSFLVVIDLESRIEDIRDAVIEEIEICLEDGAVIESMSAMN